MRDLNVAIVEEVGDESSAVATEGARSRLLGVHWAHGQWGSSARNREEISGI